MAYWDPGVFSLTDLKKIYYTNFRLIRECEKRIDAMYNDDLTVLDDIHDLMNRVNFYNNVLNTAADELVLRGYWKP